MYLVEYEGFEMKATTQKEVFDWLRIEQIDAAFPLEPLRENGYTESLCGRWSISKIDGRTVKDVDWLSDYAWIGCLVRISE